MPLPPLHRLVVSTYGWFTSLPDDVQHSVNERTVVRELASGERLYARGDEQDGLYCVISGVIRVSGLAPDGKEIVLDFYGPKVWFGEVSALDGLPRGHNADVFAACTVRHLRSSDLEELISNVPAFSRALHRLQAQRLRILLTALENYSTQPLEQRLASRLLMLAGHYGSPSARGLRIELHLSHESLAQLIGATRQRVGQIIKDWANAGILHQHYGQTIVADMNRLEKIAEASA